MKLSPILLLLTLSIPVTAQTFKTDEFGNAKATSYDTWNDQGSYRIGGQVVMRYETMFSNFACGKVSTGRVFFGGQQNFVCGNVVFMPQGTANTIFGWDAGTAMTTGNGNTLFGHDAGLTIRTSHFNTMIGANAGVGQSGRQVSESIALGAYATVTENNQAVIGGGIGQIFNVFFGSGVSSVSPQAVTIQTTGGSGLNNRGAGLVIAAGRSTGNATPASISFAVSRRGVSGATPQTLVKHWEITPTGSFRALTSDAKLETNALLMKSPSGFCYEFKVTDTGLLMSSQVGCP